jgi:hypothetical protein
MGLFNVQEICARTRALGLGGKVTISHGFCLGGIADYGIAVGGPATLFTIPASGVPEAVAAHPPRKLVLFNGRIVARDGAVLPAPAPIA